MSGIAKALDGLHRAIVEVEAAPELAAPNRKKLAKAAQEALYLSRELSKIEAQMVVRAETQGLFKRAWRLLLVWVPRIPES